jgi:hypothetical protein
MEKRYKRSLAKGGYFASSAGLDYGAHSCGRAGMRNPAVPSARKRRFRAQGDQLSVGYRRVQIVQFGVPLPRRTLRSALAVHFLGTASA